MSDALELMLFCNNEGQIDQKSDFETRLYEELSQKILEKLKDSRERCFIWMYLRTDPNHSGMVWNIFPRKLRYFVCLIQHFIRRILIPLQVGEGLDKKIIQSINPDDYDYAVAIIIGSKKKAYGKDSKNDIDILIKKIREKLEDSPVAILPFIESCTRNAHLIQS